MTNDPVCGTPVDEKAATAKTNFQGKTYAFCGEECKHAFDKEPMRYAGAHQQQQTGKPQGGSHANR